MSYLYLALALWLKPKYKKIDLRGRIHQFFSGATKLADREASGGYLVSLANGQAIQLIKRKTFSKLAIRYASIAVGRISVAVNN